jgi:bacterioferritin
MNTVSVKIQGKGPAAGAPVTPFLSDVTTLRNRAREHIEQGAVTPSYGADKTTVLNLLNEALATELVCVLRYRRHYFMAEGLLAEAIKKEFLVHAQEEQEHADKIAERIVQLGGEPNFNPEGLSSRSHSEYREGETLEAMINEDLIAERVAIESYLEMIAYLKDGDHTTRRMLEQILAVEEEHAEELSSMMKDLAAISEPRRPARPSAPSA